jgi:RecA-family ATPase
MPVPQDELDCDAAEEAWASGFGPDHGDAREPPPSATGQSHTAPNEPASPLPLIYYRDIRPALDAADFVEGLLIDGAMSVIYGESGCGKTFFALDLALHVAAGIPWFGREVDRGGVLYLALEGSHGISNRIAAFKAANLAGDADLPLAVVPVSVNLLDPAGDVVKVIEAAKEAAEKLGVPIKLIVVDTLSRALAGGNENDPQAMGALVRNIDRICQELRAHVAIVHHSGKDGAKGARGHSLLRAATDTEIEVTRDPARKTSKARVTKQRELDCDGEFAFRLESVALGMSRRKKAVTSCVVRPIDAEDLAAQAEAAKITKTAEKESKKEKDKAEKHRKKEEDVAKHLACDSEKVMRALKTICKWAPGATKNKIRECAGLNDPRAVAAIGRLIEMGMIEICQFEQASGNNTVRNEIGYRVPATPGTPGSTPGQNPSPGVDPGVAATYGEHPDKERPDKGLSLKGDPSGSPGVSHPRSSDSAESTGASTVSSPSEGKTKASPKACTNKSAPRKHKRSRAADAKPKLFGEPATMPD